MTRSAVLILLLTGCATPLGTVEVTAWGEDEATEGFAASETDGWDVSFEHWYTVIGGVTLDDPTSAELVAELPGPFIIDWAEHEQPVVLGRIDAPAGRQDVGFSFVTAGTSAEAVGSATAQVLERLEADGLSHLVQGEATNGERTVRFSWGLDRPVAYELCRNGADDTPGIAVIEDDTVTLQLTLHTDHLLWDQQGTEEARLVFDPFAAADADEDGEVTTAELAATSTLEAGLDPGSFDLPDLATYVSFAAAQAGHVNGGGLCQARAVQ